MSNLKLDMSGVLVEMNGDLTTIVKADVLAGWIANQSDKDSKKWMDIARSLQETKQVELQRRDLVDLETRIKATDMKNLIKEQLLDTINETLNQKEN